MMSEGKGAERVLDTELVDATLGEGEKVLDRFLAPAHFKIELRQLVSDVEVAETGRGPREQIASIGCSIKWRDE